MYKLIHKYPDNMYRTQEMKIIYTSMKLWIISYTLFSDWLKMTVIYLKFIHAQHAIDVQWKWNTCYVLFIHDSSQEGLTLIKTAVMNPDKSRDFKLTQPTEDVVERINALHGYVINITSVQPKHRLIFRVNKHFQNIWMHVFVNIIYCMYI